MSLTDEVARQRAHRSIIEELIADPARLGPDFQPIRALAADGPDPIVGYKATGRGQPGTELGDTLRLLQGAQALGLAERLDWAFRCLAFERALDAGLSGELHITPEPETFGTACPPRLAGVFARGRRELRIAAEIHDVNPGNHDAAVRAAAEFRAWGWRIVLAGVGEADSSAADLDRLLADLRPDVVHVDVAALAGADGGGVRRLAAAALESGAALLAVSVHRTADRDAAVALGATYARGRLMGSPGALPGAAPA